MIAQEHQEEQEMLSQEFQTPDAHHCATCCCNSIKRQSPVAASECEPQHKRPTVQNTSAVTAYLSRTMSDLCNSPGTDIAAITNRVSTCGDFSDGNSSPAKANSPALPPLPPSLRRCISDPIPTASPEPVPVVSSSPTREVDLQRLRRMKERVREMSQWCDELFPEVEHADNADTINATKPEEGGASKDTAGADCGEEVSVEREAEGLKIHFKCSCGKNSQMLLTRKNCYYQIL